LPASNRPQTAVSLKSDGKNGLPAALSAIGEGCMGQLAVPGIAQFVPGIAQFVGRVDPHAMPLLFIPLLVTCG